MELYLCITPKLKVQTAKTVIPFNCWSLEALTDDNKSPKDSQYVDPWLWAQPRPRDYGTCDESLVLVVRKAIVSKDWTVNSTQSTGRTVNREGNVPNSSPQMIQLKRKCLRVRKLWRVISESLN